MIQELIRDLGFLRGRIAVQQLAQRHHHAGDAEPALRRVLVPQRILQAVQPGRWVDPLDGGDVGALGLDGQYRTALRRAAVQEQRAGAALPGVATHLGTGQAEPVADELGQQQPGLDLGGDRLTVDGQ